MLADDFVGFIALKAPRAGIPACDHAVGVKHVDGVVCHSLNQEAVAPFFTQGAKNPVLSYHSPSASSIRIAQRAIGVTTRRKSAKFLNPGKTLALCWLMSAFSVSEMFHLVRKSGPKRTPIRVPDHQ